MGENVWIISSESFNTIRELRWKSKAILYTSEIIQVGTVNNIIVSPVDPDLVIFTGTENISWISLDCGKSISVINSGK